MDTRLHVSLRVANLDDAARFYARLLGVAPDKRHADYARFVPPGVPVVLSLIPAGSREAGLDHLGIRHADPAEARDAWARLADKGERVAPQSGVGCCYAVKDEAWLADPDGHAWEVYAVTDDSYAELAPSAGCCATTEAEEPAAATGGCCT